MKLLIRPYQPADETAVVELWQRCGLTRPWNNPRLDIERKMAVQPDLFLVGEQAGGIIASVMGGYEGHRGWINYLAVDPDFQRQGMGRAMMAEVEERIMALGCPKINLQVRASNTGVLAFYERLGYGVDDVVGMGKRLVKD
ncbi:MAG: GNAT family acetyltransferase [Caldilineales bacterium]|nr:GNAT family acetyltransferase [Caldilineales bacterium]